VFRDALRFAVAALALGIPAERALAQAGQIDFPLAPKTRWIYRLRQEVGPGVHFSDDVARLAVGNVLDTTVVSEVAGLDTIGNFRYTHVESLRNGKPWLTEWERVGAGGLFVAKTVDLDAGSEIAMRPPQRRLSSKLEPGEWWSWKAADAPVVFRTHVIGRQSIEVPAGRFQATQLSTDATLQAGPGTVQVRQTSWFVSGTGYVKQDTETSLGGRLLTHNILTLEKFEPAAP
jgi:hypothetical protein